MYKKYMYICGNVSQGWKRNKCQLGKKSWQVEDRLAGLRQVPRPRKSEEESSCDGRDLSYNKICGYVYERENPPVDRRVSSFEFEVYFQQLYKIGRMVSYYRMWPTFITCSFFHQLPDVTLFSWMHLIASLRTVVRLSKRVEVHRQLPETNLIGIVPYK